MRMDDREQNLFAACIGISILLHGAALAFAPGLRPAPAFEPPRVLEVVFSEAPKRAPEAARPEAPPVAAPAPPRKPVPRSAAPLVPLPAPDPVPVRDTPASPPQPSTAPPVPANPRVEAPPAAPAAGAAAQPASEAASPPDFRAAYLRNPPPSYPASARRKREEGTVTLRVLVSDEGQPEKIELEHSSGSTALDLAALESVRQWRFAPARRGGTPHAAWVLVPIVFRLEPGA
jgi:protein TonB